MNQQLMQLSKLNQSLLEAHKRGYKIVNEKIISPHNKILKPQKNPGGYYYFNINENGLIKHVLIHRLVAYQKYGSKLFNKGIQIRHLNGNSKDNSTDNIAIGTMSDNMMDRPKETRLRLSLNATSKNRKFTDEEEKEIVKLYQETRSYKIVMNKYNIKHKGTLHYILHKYI